MREQQPYIVKFSGGRSSGMMLMQLMQDGALKPERGDVIVFNNTSAEHSATYKFTRKMKCLAEEEYNIPFFWIEFQTYEDASRAHIWTRKPSYRLANEHPFSDRNPDGYHYKGEVFEEMISFDGYVPNMLSRTCTRNMKIFTTHSFLSDWLAQKSGIGRLGHYGDSARITDGDVIKLHRKHRGETPDEILLARKEFLRGCGYVRPEQQWADFTNAILCFENDSLKESVIGNKAQLYGDLAVDYVSCLGIRADEERRLIKIKNRIDGAGKTQGKSLFDQPPGENVLAPLIDNRITRQQVVEFWNGQDFNLELPNSGLFSNCVYCPLKGKAKLLQIARDELGKTGEVEELTPQSISWWARIEKKYGRDLVAEKRAIRSKKGVRFVGFFGASKKSVYEEIKTQAEAGAVVDEDMLALETAIPCSCTD